MQFFIKTLILANALMFSINATAHFTPADTNGLNAFSAADTNGLNAFIIGYSEPTQCYYGSQRYNFSDLSIQLGN